MNRSLPMLVPRCRVCGEPMRQRPLELQGSEERWCGAWYECEPGHGATLIKSDALNAHLEESSGEDSQGPRGLGGSPGAR